MPQFELISLVYTLCSILFHWIVSMAHTPIIASQIIKILEIIIIFIEIEIPIYFAIFGTHTHTLSAPVFFTFFSVPLIFESVQFIIISFASSSSSSSESNAKRAQFSLNENILNKWDKIKAYYFILFYHFDFMCTFWLSLSLSLFDVIFLHTPTYK